MACTVAAGDFNFPGENRGSCGPSDLGGQAPDGALVFLEQRFTCRVSANVDEVFVVQVRCPGYAPLDVRVVSDACTGLFSSCDDIELGTLVVRR